MKKPSQGREVVGKKPAWELWAESQLVVKNRGQELLDMGAFTVKDIAKKNGWSLNIARHYMRSVRASHLKWEVANDPREYRFSRVRFYFPPT